MSESQVERLGRKIQRLKDQILRDQIKLVQSPEGGTLSKGGEMWAYLPRWDERSGTWDQPGVRGKAGAERAVQTIKVAGKIEVGARVELELIESAPSKWIAWTVDAERPVPQGTRVEITRPNGDKWSGLAISTMWRAANIAAYRVV